MVVGDFGLGGGDHADEGGFTHVGEPDQPHIRDDLELQFQVQVLPRQAGLGELGDLAGGGGKMAVAPAAASAFGNHHRLIAREIRHHKAGLGLLQNGAAGHTDDQVLRVCAALALGAAVLAVLGGIFALVAEVHQSGQVIVGHKDDVAAASPVAAVRAAGRHEFFAVEGHGAIAALACMQPDGGYVNKVAGHGFLL